MEGVQNAIDTFNAADRRTTCARPRSSSRTGPSPIYLDDEDTDALRPRELRLRRPGITAAGRSTSPTTCSATTAATTSGAHAGGRSGAPATNVPAADRAAVRRLLRDVPQPRPDASRSTFDGEDRRAGGAAHRRDPLVGRLREPDDNILDVDSAGDAAGQTVDFWTWYFIEEGWDYGFVEALVDGEWVTVPLSTDADDRGHDERQPARQQRRRATASPARPAARTSSTSRSTSTCTGDAAGRDHRRPVPLLDRRGLPRHRLVRRRREVDGARRAVVERATGSRPTACRTTTGSSRSSRRAT